MLAGKWNTNNGNKQKDAEADMYPRSIYPATKQPDDIAK